MTNAPRSPQTPPQHNPEDLHCPTPCTSTSAFSSSSGTLPCGADATAGTAQDVSAIQAQACVAGKGPITPGAPITSDTITDNNTPENRGWLVAAIHARIGYLEKLIWHVDAFTPKVQHDYQAEIQSLKEVLMELHNATL